MTFIAPPRPYGSSPEVIGGFVPARWTEYMHFLYLPVVMPGSAEIRLPDNLGWARPVVEEVRTREFPNEVKNPDLHIYLTARRGYATPGNPLNRPGWHSDGFGSSDVNYIWSDRWPTRFAEGDFGEISDDHVKSAEQFERKINDAEIALDYPITDKDPKIKVYDGVPNMIYRLDPSVIHATPIIDSPGGDRSFFKISVSPNKYNLLGNSHNHLFDYEWRMWSREEIRNDPAYAGGDSAPQEES